MSMSEPYYIITKLTDSAATSSTGAIPESELKRRCFQICSVYYNTHCDFDWDRFKDILCHGEGEKGEEPMASTRHEFFKKRLRELKLYDMDSDYNGLIAQSVEELSYIFARQGHNGMSAEITMEVFNQLMSEWDADTMVSKSQDKPSPIHGWRETFWLNHGCSTGVLYGDDGEMQCNNINRHKPIDFKRDSFIDILDALPQPSPTPSRQAWEAWGDRIAAEIWPPMIFEGRDGDKKRASTKAGFLSMPCVPKG